jgi:hypothetical protein
MSNFDPHAANVQKKSPGFRGFNYLKRMLIV